MALVIAVLAWLLWTEPVSAPTTSQVQTATTTATTTPIAKSSASQATSTAPLDTKVIVSTPKSGAVVSRTFSIAGTAPSGWFFEAVFPIMVRDDNDNAIGRTQGRAQSDWTAPGPIRFTAQVTLETAYKGPATLVLMRDNPSGLPENDDSVEIPITIK